MAQMRMRMALHQLMGQVFITTHNNILRKLTTHVVAAPDPPRRYSKQNMEPTFYEQEKDYNIKQIKAMRRQTRVLSGILPQMQAIEGEFYTRARYHPLNLK